MTKKTHNKILSLIVVFMLLLSQLSNLTVTASAVTDGQAVAASAEGDEQTESTGGDEQTESVESDEQTKSVESDEQTGQTDARTAVTRSGGGICTLTWTSGIGTISGDSLEVTPLINIEQKVTLQLNFTLANGETADAGDIEIRIPTSIFTGRDGSAAGTIDMSALSTTPGEGTTGFYCYIDGEDVVITNYEAFSSDTFTCDFGYTFMPYLVEDGYTNSDIQAGVTVKEEAYSASNNLTVKVNTDAKLGDLSKSSHGKYEAWQSGWGEAPTDAADYFYVVWRILYKTNTACTQPYTVTLTDDAGFGMVVGYSTDATGVGAAGTSSSAILTFNNPDRTSSTSARYVVVKYPRSMLDGDSSPEIQNNVTAILEGKDGADGASDTKTASANYTYTSVDFTYQGDKFSVSKGGAAISSYGIINAIENNQSKQVGSTFSFQMSTTSKGWSLTNNGTKEYTTNLIDDFLYIGNEKLVASDYSITSFCLYSFTEYDYTIDEERGYKAVESTDYTSYSPVEVWYKTSDDGAWMSAGTFARTGSSSFDYTDTLGETKSVTASSYVDLPEEACAIKFTHTGSRYQVYLEANIKVNLNPTDNVKEFLKDKSEVELYNVDTLIVTDEQGNIRNSANTSTISGTAIKNTVIDHDTNLYGQTVQHGAAYSSLSRVSAETFLLKRVKATKSDAVNGQEILSYTISMYERSQYEPNSLTKEEMIVLGIVPEQTSGVFYDLLPAGTVVDTSTIAVTTYDYNEAGTACPYTVELVENWQNSGQTMMIVSVSVPEGTENYYVHKNLSYFLHSGFILKYDLIYTWQNINDYGRTALNTVAYRSGVGKLADGTTASSSAITNKNYYSDLNDDGTDDDGDNNTVYVQDSTTLSPLQASQMGLSKSVKAADDLTYAKTAEVPSTGTYSYQLRFANGEGTAASGVVFYDILEAYESGDASQWKGTLVSIDTSYAESKGIVPVIYYSTAVGLDSADTASFENLGDSSIWTTTQPADLSTVTAVAIDCSKDTKGDDYYLSLGETLLCYVTMRAPADHGSYTDPDVYAYNSTYCKMITETVIGDPVTFFKASTPVSVSLRPADISINKTSDPASGTQTDPGVVQRNDTIDYTIAVTNTNTTEAIIGAEITDVIPTELTIDTANIKYYFGTDTPELISDFSRISMTIDGHKLVFSVDKLAAGETVYLVIPTMVPANAKAQTLYENTAEVTAINGSDYSLESKTTYHAVESVFGSFTIKKVDEDDTSKVLEGAEFTLKDEEGNTVSFTWDDENSRYVYSESETDVILTSGPDGLIVIADLPEGTYTLTESRSPASYYTASTDSWTITVTAEKVTSTEDASLSWWESIVSAVSSLLGIEYGNCLDENGIMTVTNKYVPTPASVTLTGTKTLRGKDLEDDMFSFIVKDTDGNTAATATNKADGTITFSDLTFDTAGTYTYTVSEVNGKAGGITYDNTVYTVNITVEDNGDGTLTAAASYPDGSIEFENSYNTESTTLGLTGTKTLSGKDLKDDMFSFIVKDTDGNTTATATNKADGTITFGAIGFTASGTYTYTVSEVSGEANGITYDDTEYTVTVTVEDNGDGTLTAAASYPDGSIEFENRYSTESTTLGLTGTKMLSGKDLEDDMFSFIVKDTDGNTAATATNKADGTITFSDLTFDTAGTYTYTVSEVNGKAGGITYDNTVYTVNITVEDNGDGTLTAAASYPDGSIEFENNYNTESATLGLTGTKTLSGKDLEDDMFSFIVKDTDDNTIATATNKADGTITFGAIGFTASGTYTYTVSEVSGKANGITYDDTEYTVTVTVVDNGDGTLTATASYTDEGTVFKNSYDGGKRPNIKTPKTSGPTASIKKVAANPGTGDGNALYWWTIILCASFSLLGVFIVTRRKKRQ